MKQVIMPRMAQETETTVDLQLIKCRPVFIQESESGKIVGMFCNYSERESATSDYGKSYWIASTGFGGLVGRHNTLEECMRSAYCGGKYKFVTDIIIP